MPKFVELCPGKWCNVSGRCNVCMKILHLTDIHISEDIAETVLDRAKTIAQAMTKMLCRNYLKQGKSLYFVL